MRLEPLFEGELVFDEATEVAFPAYGEDGDWFGYVQGHGSIEGERLSGELRWTNHPRCRADGTWLPNYQGTITTAEGANLLFSSRGYNQGVGDPFGSEHRSAICSLTFAASEERYRWVNGVFAVLEAEIRPSADPERWRIRAYECVNELAPA
jgi:Protein of unknown function (DUF3237)